MKAPLLDSVIQTCMVTGPTAHANLYANQKTTVIGCFVYLEIQSPWQEHCLLSL